VLGRRRGTLCLALVFDYHPHVHAMHAQRVAKAMSFLKGLGAGAEG
jgi:hypothetical protein